MNFQLKPALIIFLIFVYIGCSAQSITTCLHSKVETPEECEKAEPCIEKLCDYVLSKPMIEKDENIHKANKLILSWMNVTMNYGFTINDKLMNLFQDDNALLFSIYMICLAKGAFISREYQDFKGLQLLVDYIQSPDNKVVQTKDIKKFVRDWEKGNAKKYIIRGTMPN